MKNAKIYCKNLEKLFRCELKVTLIEFMNSGAHKIPLVWGKVRGDSLPGAEDFRWC